VRLGVFICLQFEPVHSNILFEVQQGMNSFSESVMTINRIKTGVSDSYSHKILMVSFGFIEIYCFSFVLNDSMTGILQYFVIEYSTVVRIFSTPAFLSNSLLW